MTENKIQAKIIKYLLTKNIMCSKIEATGRGWPDVLAILPNGVVLFLEIKTPTGRLSPYQVRVHHQLREQHANVYTIRDFHDLETALARHGGPVEQAAGSD
jgi:hypothetical protein